MWFLVDPGLNKPAVKDILRTTEKLNRGWLLDDIEAFLTIMSGEIWYCGYTGGGLSLLSKDIY